MKKRKKKELIKKKNSRAFTLIEMLIVLAIIGVLASFLITNLLSVREKARDGARKADIAEMRSALEIYHNETGTYPLSQPDNTQLNNTPCSNPFTANDIIYLKSIPCDPLGTTSDSNNGNYYYYSPDGKSYTIAACLEDKSDPDGQSHVSQ